MPEASATTIGRRCRRFAVTPIRTLAVLAAAKLAVASLLGSCCGPAIAPTPLPAAKILDLHCHAAGIGAGDSGCFVAPALRGSWKYEIYLRSFGVSEAELLAQGDGLMMQRLAATLARSRHVGGAVVLALDGVVDGTGELDLAHTEVYVPNEFVRREVAKYPNLRYGASINPYRRDALARLAAAKRDGAVLLKWLPNVMQVDPADPRLIPFYRRLKELELPLLVHTGAEDAFSHSDNRLGDPQRLRLPLEQGVTVIAAHVATRGRTEGQDNMERLLPLFAEYPNLYADISSLTQANKVGCLARLLPRRELHGRLLYGTDAPLIATLLVSPWYFPLDLSPAQMWQISRIENPWDRDVVLKQALGLPREVFARSAELLQVQMPE